MATPTTLVPATTLTLVAASCRHRSKQPSLEATSQLANAHASHCVLQAQLPRLDHRRKLLLLVTRYWVCTTHEQYGSCRSCRLFKPGCIPMHYMQSCVCIWLSSGIACLVQNLHTSALHNPVFAWLCHSQHSTLCIFAASCIQ
jgi:hypothetical protein